MADHKQILLTQHGLHRVDFMDTVPVPRACSSCAGDCPFPTACMVPEPSTPARRRFPPISRPILVGAALAFPGAMFLVVEGVRYLLHI